MPDLKNPQNHIPDSANVFLVSIKATYLNLEICNKYDLSGDNIKKHTDLITALFYKNISLADLVSEIKKIFSFDDVKAKKMAADIAGIRLLVVKDWINGVEEYLRSLGADPKNYEKYVTDQISAIAEEKKQWEEELRMEKEKEERLLAEKKPALAEEAVYIEPDLEKEKIDSLTVFSSRLADLLSSSSPELIKEYNDILLDILAGEKGFAYCDKLFRALLSNEEKITAAPFVLEKKAAVGTIGNWLRNFIEEKGSGSFNNIILSDFLSKSENSAKLNEEERRIIKQLLILYRNLKFFPESMPNDTGEDWQIIPFESPEEDNKNLAVAKERLEKEKEAINQPAAERAKKIAELKAKAQAYPPRSFERRAIENEIKKLE